MATTSTSQRIEPPQIQALAQRLKAWRARRTPGRRIPEELWKAATELAQLYGLSRTATALKLSYYDLQRRLWTKSPPRRQQVIPPAFVELTASPSSGSSREGGSLEIVRVSGARLIVRLPNPAPRDFLALVQLFLRHRS
jgi:hypothetical protein